MGIAYYYSGQTTARPGNEETNTGAIQGTLIQIDQKKESAAISGSQGNDGWGGLNLTRYWNIKDGRHGTSSRESEGRTIYVNNQVEVETLYGSYYGEQVPTLVAKVYKQFTSLDQETPGFFGLNIVVRSGRDWNRNDDEVVYQTASTGSILETPACYQLRTYAGYGSGWYNGTGGTKTYINTNDENTYGKVSIYYNITGSYGYELTKYTYNNVTFNVYAGPEGEFLSAVCYGY